MAAATARLSAQSESAPGLGFIGLGARSKAHFAAFKDLPGVRVAALCDLQSARIEETNSQLPSKAEAYTDYRELLHDKKVGAVVIATPNYLHYEMAIAALRAGKDVLLEKPMGINYQQAKEIRAEAIRSGRVLAIGIQRLYGSDGLMIELIRRGEVGNVKVINAGEYRGDWNPRTSVFTDPVTGKSGIWRDMKRAAGSSELEFSVHLYAALCTHRQLAADAPHRDRRHVLLSESRDTRRLFYHRGIRKWHTAQPQLRDVLALSYLRQSFRR